MSENLQTTLVEELQLLLLPLAVAHESDVTGRLLFDVTGWELTPGSDNKLLEFINAYNQLNEIIAQPPATLLDVLEVLDAVGRLAALVREVSAQPASTVEAVARDLIGALVIQYFKNWRPAIYDLLVLLTIIRPPAEISLKRIPDLVKDPLAVLRTEYLNGLVTTQDANELTDKLFPPLASLLTNLGYPSKYRSKSESGPALGALDGQLAAGMLTVFLQPDFEEQNRYGVAFALSPKELGDLGFVVIPFGEVMSNWEVLVDLTPMSAGFAVGPKGLTMFGAAEAGGVSAGSNVFGLSSYLIGGTTSTRLELGKIALSGDLNLKKNDQEYGFIVDLGPAALVISAGDGDSFLQAIVPPEGVRVDFDLAIGWSNKKGFHFRGSAGLDMVLPVQVSVRNVLTVSSIQLAIKADGSAVRLATSASVGAHVGPIHALVEQVGLEAVFTFPETGGNLGICDLDFHFKPPNGMGFAIGSAVVHGGGFLAFDQTKGQYTGIVELEIAEKISVKGFALLNTRIAGSTGYSLVVVIFVEGFSPIQLGFGFVLTGIGGLLAVNRTFDEEALRAGLKNHALDSVMFPADPVRNAPQIVSNISRLFPPANKHHLFGPMVRIAWGTPALITAEVALVLEFGARRRLLILAQVLSVLPRPQTDLVRLQMNAVGVVDFDQGTAALDATLHDSRLLNRFPITGDMAMRLNWQASPNFAVAVGGLHPAFNPPPNFPKLQRVAISLSAGDNPRLRCEAYFALTSNSVQFGARAELYAAAAGFSINGQIGFDVLIQLAPFHFVADFFAQVQLKRGSTNLFKVRVEGSLSGPRPLHVKGKATFEILWWDYSVRFDKTLVGGEKPPLPEVVEVFPLLREALAQPGNWSSQLPDGQRALVTLRSDALTGVLLHPLGTLTIKQTVVPLNFDISKFGPSPPAGTRRFSITQVSVGNTNQTINFEKDFFAPAQFVEMSDDQKLSRPSFEKMDAGVSFGSTAFKVPDDAEDRLPVNAIEFETWIIDKQTNEPRPADPVAPNGKKVFYQLSDTRFRTQSRFGAAGSSELRRSGTARYRTMISKHRIEKEGWTIVASKDLAPKPLAGVPAGKPVSYAEAAAALSKLQRNDPARAAGLKILRRSDLERLTIG